MMLLSLNTMPVISGYEIIEEIYFGSKTLVFRAIREKDQKSVIIKLMRNEHPSFNEIAQFRNQYIITKDLNISGIVKSYDLETYRNGYALVMEDFGGISLLNYLNSIQQKHIEGCCQIGLPINTFFPIAIQIASILDELHRQSIIHKDIKPDNILINPLTSEVKLIDFSIASLLPREIQSLTNPNILEGTLAYISPEQTGRMNRGIDYRSDFYSLGVTFFEILTGQLPFSINDSMELVYYHIAKQPPNANTINSNIPCIVSDIISKLMVKNPEDRYQSGLGLKHDLEVCKQNWQDNGRINAFKLGQQDISDRFLISDKLYGRENEIETLLAAFDRVTKGKSEMILVSGASGIGKTAVINEIHKPIVRQHSYFIKGKFEQFQRNIPLSGLVQAFQDLIGQILSETDAQIQQWKAKILSALGEQAQIIIDLIPKLELIIGKQPPVVEISGIAAQNRFNFLFQRFVQVFKSKDHPLIMFLDDLQWADVASLKLIQLLMSESYTIRELEKSDNQFEGGFLLIGAYRNNEVSPAHPLCLTVDEIEQSGVNINNITLRALNQDDLNYLVVDTLHCSQEVANPLTQMIFTKTQGNPFFVNQFLKYLHDHKLIKFNFDLGRWHWNITEIKELVITDDVVEFMALQLEKLPKNTLEILKIAACIGHQFDLKTLAIVYQKSEVDTAADLWSALVEGLILTDSDGDKLSVENPVISDKSTIISSKSILYKFVHDRVQQAVYSLIPEIEKNSIHLKIGQLLLNNTPVAEREENVFNLVNQLNIAKGLVTNQRERDELARMNLIAGRKALASTSYLAAVNYLIAGIEVLADDSWETQYELTLSLYETAAEAAYLSGNFEQTEKLVEVVLQQATNLLDQVKVCGIKIQAYGAQNQAMEAVNTALAFLKLLGIEFPDNPSQSDIQLEMEKTRLSLANRQIEDLIHLPEMTEAQPLAAMRILSIATSWIYQVVPQLFPLIVLKQIEFSLKYGNIPLSAYAYVNYGLMLCALAEDIESGYQFGKLATNIVATFNNREIQTKVMLVFNTAICHWKEHISKTLEPLLEAYTIGIETGDLEFTAYCLNAYSYSSYWIGKELNQLEKQMAVYCNTISSIKQKTILNWSKIYRKIILSLIENPEDNSCLDEMLKIQLEANDLMGIFVLFISKLHLFYLFNKFTQAVENAVLAEKYLAGGIAQVITPIFYFYDSLAKLALHHKMLYFEQESILIQVEANQNKLHHWANHTPMNYLHKYYLVEAEKHRVLGEYLEAMECFDRAIALAKEHEYINEEALANEVAGRFYLEWGKQKIAQTYLIDAYYCYIRWGAKAKVEDLEKRYPELLAPILYQEKFSSKHNTNSSTDRRISLSTHPTNQTVIGSSNISISGSLDLKSVIKASQALSGEIEMEQLLSTLMQVVMENAGASKSALILSEGNSLNLVVTTNSCGSVGAPTCTEFPKVNLESSSNVPVTLINYVKRTQETLVIDDVSSEILKATDSYIISQQPKSLLCMPIINQGKLLGILYLENNLTTGAFTRERVEILKLLTTQAAISLENAILYRVLAQANESLEEYNHTLEEKVHQRTQELNENNERLQQTLEELRTTQTQLIQSEKMSSLGQMVAGIAHEINNPINFIHGNISHAHEYVKDLLDLISIYQQEYPNPSPLVKEKALDIDQDFLVEDLPRLLDSMNVGTSRIRNIVLSLRNFSRLDEAEMKSVDIHEGIDNTLMILQHRLKAKSDCPEIRVIKEYGQLPEIVCYPSALNQVFMNILSNAIDALQEREISTSYSPTPTPQIHIRTQLIEDQAIKIQIADNGSGMSDKVLQKIFDPFFTTKPVGSGTGLGLSISYQIVVDKHKGQLICNSILGQGTEFVIEIPIQQ